MKTYKQFMEDAGIAPANSLGSGGIAGTREAGHEPPVSKMTQKKIAARSNVIKRLKPNIEKRND